MRKFTALVFTFALLHCVHAQPGRPAGPGTDRLLAKIFGNSAFSADIVFAQTNRDQSTTMPGKIASDAGKIRTEIDLAGAKAQGMRPENTERLKTMGMDKTVTISRPDKKIAYLLYPNASAYTEAPLNNAETNADATLKIKTTELGKETVGGHPCVKNKVVITDDQGTSDESTVWNATDLKNVPVKIEMRAQGYTLTFTFSNVKTGKPDAALFEVPAGYKKYESKSAIIMEQMKKQMGNTNTPPTHP